MHPIDLVEDIAIGHGYERFEPRIPKIPTLAVPLEGREFANKLREVMVGLGYQEAVTFVLTNEKEEFEKVKKQETERVQIQNPKTVDYTMARLDLIPSLLRIFAQNQASEFPQKVFELGLTLKPDKNSETGAANVLKIAAGISHSQAGYTEMKSNLEAFMRNIGKTFELSDIKDEAFLPGRVAQLSINGNAAGIIGEIHPEALGNFKIDYPVVLFELNVEKLK